jgi:hypothetical protein
MGWTVRRSNSRGGEIFCAIAHRSWGPPSLLYNGYGVSFPGVKWPGRGVDHPPPSCAKVKERVELYLYSPSDPSWPVIRLTSTLLLWDVQFLYFYKQQQSFNNPFYEQWQHVRKGKAVPLHAIKAADEGGRSALCSRWFTPGMHWTGDWMGLKNPVRNWTPIPQ